MNRSFGEKKDPISPLNLPPEKIPRHVAIIMDGNGRWAKQRGLPRTEGHREGMKAIQRALECAREWGIRYMTFYAFSTENFKRPREEVEFLFTHLKNYLEEREKELHKNEIRLHIIGDRKRIPSFVQDHLFRVERETQRYDRWHLIVALAYGGRDEILRAIRRWYNDPERVSPEELTEEIFSSYLDTKGIPEPDLLIRTSMEQRISNFLLWQCAYTEFVFVEDYWPDFNGELFKKILHIYARRERRFGDIAPSPSR